MFSLLFKYALMDKRLQELCGMMQRGNHKSTEKEADKTAELLPKDVAQMRFISYAIDEQGILISKAYDSFSWYSDLVLIF